MIPDVPPSRACQVPPTPPLRTGELLVEHGVISASQLESALRHQATQAPTTRLGRIVVALGFATSEQVLRLLATHLNCPFADVGKVQVQREAVEALSAPFLEKHNLLPLRIDKESITVALEQFTDPFIIDEIAHRSGLRVCVNAADPEAIRAVRRAVMEGKHGPAPRRADTSEQSLEAIFGRMDVQDLQVVEESKDEDADIEATATESPIVKLVNYIIKRAVEVGASDIHIEPAESLFRVRYRVDGELVVGEQPVRRLLPAVVSRIKILARMDISERRLPQDGSLTVNLGDRAIDLRVSTMTTKQGEKVVLRLVDREGTIRSLEQLGIEGTTLVTLRELILEPHGLILVTGPTGSGKSTTLYSALSEIVSEDCNTSTIEDPVERRLKGVNQFQVHEDFGFTFARSLRSLLRQDPDVIMVGEIRDSDTARLATEAALTGHLVLSTLHTNDAPSTIPRLVSMGAERYVVAATLRGVLAQRLVRRLCEACRRPTSLSPAQLRVLEAVCDGPVPLTQAYAGTGCPRCNNRGSIGRVGVFDLLTLNEDVLSGLLVDANHFPLEKLRRSRGVPGLLADGLVKVNQGLIGLESLLELVCRAGDAGTGSALPTTPRDRAA